MDLLKYLPEYPKGNVINCNNLQSLYVYNGFTLTDQIRCGIFLTSNDFNRPDLAQDKLSITFRPKVAIDIDQSSQFNVWKNYGGIISCFSADDSLSRVWPAFGYTGGAFEYIYECKDCEQKLTIQTKAARRGYPTGGLKDFFHGKSVRLQNFNLTSSKEMIEFLKNLYPTFEQNEDNDKIGQYEGKRKVIKLQEHGFSTAILGRLPTDLNISISLGIRDISPFSVCNLWVYLWIDDYINKKRDVYGPIQKSWLIGWGTSGSPSWPPHATSIAKKANTLLGNALQLYQQGTLVVRQNLVLP